MHLASVHRSIADSDHRGCSAHAPRPTIRLVAYSQGCDRVTESFRFAVRPSLRFSTRHEGDQISRYLTKYRRRIRREPLTVAPSWLPSRRCQGMRFAIRIRDKSLAAPSACLEPTQSPRIKSRSILRVSRRFPSNYTKDEPSILIFLAAAVGLGSRIVGRPHHAPCVDLQHPPWRRHGRTSRSAPTRWRDDQCWRSSKSAQI